MSRVKRALISVSDKSYVVDFAQRLAALNVQLVSTGGTANTLRDAGLGVRDVSDVTGFPEIMDGRVKTLHPSIHAGILAVRENKEHMRALAAHHIDPFDLVACNLYPFSRVVAKPGVTFEEAIENIDIGGPAMLRSAAKNHHDIIVVADPHSYYGVATALEREGDLSDAERLALAYEVFRTTHEYDRAIEQFFADCLSGIRSAAGQH